VVSISIVVFKNEYLEIEKALLSIFNLSLKNIYIIDNSPTEDLKSLMQLNDKIVYIHNPSNPGFGAAHNIAIKKAIEVGSNYHFIVNPDIIFIEDAITPMVKYMLENPDIGMMMPQILNEDGTIQNLPKLLPSPYSIILRKLKKPNFLYNPFIDKYELRSVTKGTIYNAPVLSGCFTLLNLNAIKEIGMYDDRFFMYFEDWDLSRRMHQKYKTIYYPLVSVIHGYESGANKNSRLFKIFINSAMSYFIKWGWFFDFDRIKINKKALKQFQ
jgi:GT2 family glycosyltransferase